VTLAVAASIKGDVVHPWLDFIGLIIIGLGTGGIKPCVQPFGADQFKKGQEKQLAQFFSIFYFLINAGSTISILVTPIFRVTPCEGQKTCYPLAFGVPAALMVIAVMFFALGGFWYKKSPPKGNVFSKVAKTIGVAIKNKSFFEVKRDHWLDHYLDSHNCNYDEECRESGKCEKVTFVEDIKAILRLLVVFVPLPIFWALYEQQGSTWVIQATEMNPEIAPSVYFLPDQMGVLNAILIMVLIPIFSLGIYPLFNKFFNVTALRKMCVGCFLAGVAYIVCMLIQIQLKPTLASEPKSGQTILNVSNYVQTCDKIHFMATDGNKYWINEVYNRNETRQYYIPVSNTKLQWGVQEVPDVPCDWARSINDTLSQKSMTLTADMVGYTIFTNSSADLKVHQAQTLKSQSGEAVFSVNVNFYVDNTTGRFPPHIKVGFCRREKNDQPGCKDDDEELFAEFAINDDRTSDYVDVGVGKWEIYWRDADNDNKTWISTGLTFNQTVRPDGSHRIGGIYTVTLLSDPNDSEVIVLEYVQQSPDNTYSILWQIPQYFVISVAEVLFSITGYEFAYSQAPNSMKSVVFALYLLTDAVGNVIILIITSVTSFGADLTWLFLIYACLMFVITVVFIVISIRYKYTTYVNEDDSDKK